MPANRTKIYALTIEDLNKILLPHLISNGIPKDSLIVTAFHDPYRGTLNCIIFNMTFDVVAPGFESPVTILKMSESAT